MLSYCKLVMEFFNKKSMKKIAEILLVSLVFTLIGVSSVSAFSIDLSITDQVDTSDGIAISDEQVELDMASRIASKLFINPNFPTWRDMYLSTSDGVYINRQYDADWNKQESLSELFPTGLTEIKFDGKYYSNRMMLAYDTNSVYISYNAGDSWTDITPETDEEILFADFGPDYADNKQLYFITETGLYRESMSSGAITLLVESVQPGDVHNFRYVRTQSSDAVFYVVNGDTLLKTENYGDSWIEEKFESNIRDFEIMQKTYEDGHLMVLTEDSKIHYATFGMNFFDLDLPEEINVVYACDYIILTDQGFYVTYNEGGSWSKLEYDPANINAVSDYDFAYDGTLKSFFAVNDGVLYRDYNANEVFEEYMGGFENDLGYVSSGEVVSLNLIDLLDESYGSNYVVEQATLFADGDLNEQSISFYMTADGGNWEEVETGVQHTFAYPGNNLKWKAVLSTTDSAVTPVLRSVSADFGFEESAGCAGFSDIAFDDPDCAAIEYVKAQGIFEGYEDGTFGIDTAINRAETVKVITEGFDYVIDENTGGDLGFPDVDVAAWYMDYLSVAKTAGIIEGYEDGTFHPAETVNYAEMMKIFLETADVEIGEDVSGEEWYQKYVDYADVNDLVIYEDVTSGMKRGDVAKLFYQWSL